MKTKTENQASADWNVEAISEQIWSDLNGAVSRSTIQEALKDIIPKYENARIQTFVPIFIRRDAVQRLRTMQPPIGSQMLNEVDVANESRSNSDLAEAKTANDDQDKTIDTDLVHWEPAR